MGIIISGSMAFTNGINLGYTCEKVNPTPQKIVEYKYWTDNHWETTDNVTTAEHYEKYERTERTVTKDPSKNDEFFPAKVIPAVNIVFGLGSGIYDGMKAVHNWKKGDSGALKCNAVKLLGEGLMVAGAVSALATGNVTIDYAATMLVGAIIKTCGDLGSCADEDRFIA